MGLAQILQIYTLNSCIFTAAAQNDLQSASPETNALLNCKMLVAFAGLLAEHLTLQLKGHSA